jgi:light-regulated signal transduction histidine kinase (bacteriophytochrome)
MASHDLQEPLRKIITFSDHLSAKFIDKLDDEGRMHINRIQNAAERMQVLIRDIMSLSKIASDKSTFVFTDLNVLLQEVTTDLERRINEKNANILIDKLPSFCINQGMIYSLFHNLISNSLKYSKKGVAPDIRISSEIYNTEPKGSDKKQKFCRIYVSDNGIGFDQKDSDQIFSIFKRLHSSAEFDGTGIGLAICKKIVEKHNGFITAKSKVNEGSTFIISLPLVLDYANTLS